MVGVKIGLVSVEVEIGLLLLLFSILFAPFHLVVSTFRGLSVLSDLDLPHMIPHCLCFHSQFNRRLRGTLQVVSS